MATPTAYRCGSSASSSEKSSGMRVVGANRGHVDASSPVKRCLSRFRNAVASGSRTATTATIRARHQRPLPCCRRCRSTRPSALTELSGCARRPSLSSKPSWLNAWSGALTSRSYGIGARSRRAMSDGNGRTRRRTSRNGVRYLSRRTCVRILWPPIVDAGSPHTRLRRPLLTKNTFLIDAVARELPHVGLADALPILVVMAEKRASATSAWRRGRRNCATAGAKVPVAKRRRCLTACLTRPRLRR
jgi:hypothetical protein